MSDVKEPKTDADPTQTEAEGDEPLSEEQLEAVSGGILIGMNQAAQAWKLVPALPAVQLGDTSHKDLTGDAGIKELPSADSAFKFFKK